MKILPRIILMEELAGKVQIFTQTKIGKNGCLLIQTTKKYAFKNWGNSNNLEKSIFESVSIFKGDFGTTIIYKSTEFSFKNSSTGNL